MSENKLAEKFAY